MDELHYQYNLLRAKNQTLESTERMYRSICNTSTNAFLYYSFADNKLFTMGAWENYFDIRIDSIKNLASLTELVQDKYQLALREILYLEQTKMERAFKEVCLLNGKKWVECEVNISYDEKQKPIEKIIRFKDITKFKKQNDELSYLAYYDILTGLYNRNYFVRILADWLRKAETDKSVVSVVFIDIDDFRKINDGLGLIVGDELVQVFGQFLGTFSQENVIVSHFNSDIYCMAIYDPCGNRTVDAIYQEIQNRLQKPFLLSTRHELDITVSVGVAEYPEAAKSALELINCAEIVMFKSKAGGKNGLTFFDTPILNDFLKNIEIENKLKEALFANQFELNFQPQYDSSSGRLRGVEALIRWKDHMGKSVSPSDFIPIAEKNGTIVPIGNWVIDEAIRILAEVKRKYRIDFVMSINISAIQYKRDEFVGDLIAILRKYDVKPDEIELEITETVLIDDFKLVKDKMHTLREYGVKVSLDDFGTGFSSLSYLKGLPIDTLKIDKSFVDTVILDESTRIIMESIIHMAKRLGYDTVAEGVETKEQYDYLKSIGCDTIQGFYLSKPMSVEAFEQLLSEMIH